MCLTDVGSFLSDLTKLSVTNDLLISVFLSCMKQSRPVREMIWGDVCFTVYLTPGQATIFTL